MDKRYELNMSLYQLGIILLFNVAPTWTAKEIREQTKLNDAEIARILKVIPLSRA